MGWHKHRKDLVMANEDYIHLAQAMCQLGLDEKHEQNGSMGYEQSLHGQVLREMEEFTL